MSHLGYGRQWLFWTEPSGTIQQPYICLCRATLGRCGQQDSVASSEQHCPGQHPPGHSQRSPEPALDRNCSLLLALPWCLLWACPAASSAQRRQDLQAGPLGHGLKFPRAVPGAHMALSGGAPRPCPEGGAFIPGAASRELPFGSARAAAGGAALRFAALSCAALCSSPDRAGAAGCRVSASAACRAGSGGW